ncbi:MAG: GDSL-type esterase/lipase family protein [Vicinamibacterales bacterium]
MAVIPSFRTVRIVIVATLVAVVVSMAMVEAWVRYSWDDKKGRPGFYLSDPLRGQRLAPGYQGWFAGVPVKINNLGFRDEREYTLAKPPGTFRIIVLGDSVTFGHGAPFATTYPFLVEERLKAWRPDVKWEVWNLGVPGYNTSQELAYLEQVGRPFSPDLVVVGFYPNDFTANERVAEPSLARRLGSAMQAIVQRTMYSYEFYKRAYLTLRWQLMTDKVDQQRIEHLATEDQLLETTAGGEDAARILSPAEFIDDSNAAEFVCPGAQSDVNSKAPTELARALRGRSPSLASWFEAVDGLQQLHASGAFRVMFFINMAPIVCAGADRFVDGGTLGDDDAMLEVLGKGTPAVSSTRAFLHYHPSQMPAAGGHSLGNSNRVKADVLFDFLKTQVLPPLLPGGGAR